MNEEGAIDQVGLRLAAARKRAGLTQEQLGEALDLDKTQVSKIERGHRRLDISEVAAAAGRLGTTTRALLGMGERSKLALAARLATDAPEGAFKRAQTRARQIVEVDDVLSEICGLTPSLSRESIEDLSGFGRRLAEQGKTSDRAIREQGRLLADETRRLLDLGSGALGDLPDLIETYFGVDVALSPLGTDADGLCVHADDVRLILASSDFTSGHVRFTLAHELGHHLFGDPRDIIGEDHAAMFAKTATERRANAFAANFLMPEKGIRAFLDFRSEVSPISPSGIVQLIVNFQVSLQAMSYRLQELGLLPAKDAEAIRDRPVKDLVRTYADNHAAQLATQVASNVRPPTRLLQAARTGFAQRQIGLGPIASLLERMDDAALFDELMTMPEIARALTVSTASDELVV